MRETFVRDYGDATILVCASCGRRSCYDGTDVCDRSATTIRPNVKLLAAADLEHWSAWWKAIDFRNRRR